MSHIELKSRVLDLQELLSVTGGTGRRDEDPNAWSTTSNNCGSVGEDEWSTQSNGCAR